MCSRLIQIGILVFATILAEINPVRAQDNYYYSDPDKDQQQVKTLFSRKATITGFGTLDVKISQILDQTSLWMGLTGGVIIDHDLIIGLGGYGLTTEIKYDQPQTGIPLDLTGGYGGIVLGYNLAHQELVHVTFPILIGAGGLDVTNDVIFIPENNPDLVVPPNGFRIDASNFFVLEPGALLELNLTTWFRLGLGGHYRFIKGTQLDGISDADLRSWVATFSLKFGKF